MNKTATLFDQMQQRFNPTAAEGMDAVFQYNIEDGGTWQVKINNDSCSIMSGDESEASVVLHMDSNTLEGVMTGEIDGMQAFMSGDITATGDVMLATRLADIFPSI